MKCYSENILAIEETDDPSKFTREQLIGTLLAFEMIKFSKSKVTSETIFKESNVPDEDSKNDENLDEIEEKFVRKMKRELTSIKVCYLSNVLHVERLIIMHLDVQKEDQKINLRKTKKNSIRKDTMRDDEMVFWMMNQIMRMVIAYF